MNKDWTDYPVSEENATEWQCARIYPASDGSILNRVYVLLVAELAAYVKWDGCVSLQEFDADSLADRTDINQYEEKFHICNLQSHIDELQELQNIAKREVYRIE